MGELELPVRLEADRLPSLSPDKIVGDASWEDYRTAFVEKAAETNDADRTAQDAWTLLSEVVGMRLRAENVQEPFEPMVRLLREGKRSAALEDFGDAELDLLEGLLAQTRDAALCARVADVLWLTRRSPTCASTAVNCYIDAVVDDRSRERWPTVGDWLERALRLAAQHRRTAPALYDRVVQTFLQRIGQDADDGQSSLAIRLLGVLSDFGRSDARSLMDRAMTLAQSAREDNQFTKAELAYEAARRWAARAKDAVTRVEVDRQQAEAYAENARSADGGLASALFMEKAIERYKSVPDSRLERDSLYQELRTYQRAAASEMRMIRLPSIDIEKFVEHAESAVAGKPWREAMLILAVDLFDPESFDQLEKSARESLSTFSPAVLFDTVHIDNDGLHIATTPSWLGGEEGEVRLIWSKMISQTQRSHALMTQGFIEPARDTIILEHPCTEHAILELVRDSPFVPEGSVLTYAKGLRAGLIGDSIVAAHILSPQLEGCMRHVLEQHGVETTSLNPHGLQEHMRMKAILGHATTEEVFGRDVVGHLRAILIEPKYANLKNGISHALQTDDQLHNDYVTYLWWLALRLCLFPTYSVWQGVSEESNG